MAAEDLPAEPRRPLSVRVQHGWRRHRRIVFVALIAVLVAVSWSAVLDAAALRQLDAGGLRALAAFAVARGLNAGISLLQGTEIALQPMGVGLTLAVGQVLDPVNDLVEHFANLTLFAAVAFGVEGLLVRIGGHWAVSLGFSLCALAWAQRLLSRQSVPAWLGRALVLFVFVRLALPLAFVASDFAFRHFLEADYREGTQVIERLAGQIDALAPPPSAQESAGVLDRLKDWGGAQIGDLKARLAALKAAAEQSVERIVRLMVVFIVQTCLLPLLSAWLLWRLLRAAVAPRA